MSPSGAQVHAGGRLQATSMVVKSLVCAWVQLGGRILHERAAGRTVLEASGSALASWNCPQLHEKPASSIVGGDLATSSRAPHKARLLGGQIPCLARELAGAPCRPGGGLPWLPIVSSPPEPGTPLHLCKEVPSEGWWGRDGIAATNADVPCGHHLPTSDVGKTCWGLETK